MFSSFLACFGPEGFSRTRARIIMFLSYLTSLTVSLMVFACTRPLCHCEVFACTRPLCHWRCVLPYTSIRPAHGYVLILFTFPYPLPSLAPLAPRCSASVFFCSCFGAGSGSSRTSVVVVSVCYVWCSSAVLRRCVHSIHTILSCRENKREREREILTE